MTASSQHNPDYRAAYGRLHGDRGEGWCAKTSSRPDDWLQIDLGKWVHVCAVATQGDRNGNEWTTHFKLVYSANGINWKTCEDENGNQMEFHRAGANSRKVSKHDLPVPVNARYIRFNPTRRHRWNCLRVEVYGAPVVGKYRNCAEVYKSGKRTSGVYKIDPDGLGEFEVFCDQTTAGGGWTVFQKRMDGSVDFYRAWDDYKRGFGDLKGEFWLGLDKIHRMTISSSNKLRVDLEDFDGNKAFAEYTSFGVADEAKKYQLSLGSYSGTAGDSLGYHRDMVFSTKDRDNDKHPGIHCALKRKGAWWYKDCFKSNLNGLYLHGERSWDGVVWEHWKDDYSMKRSEMKIRPEDY